MVTGEVCVIPTKGTRSGLGMPCWWEAGDVKYGDASGNNQVPLETSFLEGIPSQEEI